MGQKEGEGEGGRDLLWKAVGGGGGFSEGFLFPPVMISHTKQAGQLTGYDSREMDIAGGYSYYSDKMYIYSIFKKSYKTLFAWLFTSSCAVFK